VAPREERQVKIQTAGNSTGVIEVGFPAAERPVALRAPVDDLLAKHLEQNARTWAVLERLGVREGTELSLAFAFEACGAAEDQALADRLRNELGYTAEVDEDGVSGSTTPMLVSPAGLDHWVASMLRLGAFSGWTATVRR
jgi:hypothetical protein